MVKVILGSILAALVTGYVAAFIFGEMGFLVAFTIVVIVIPILYKLTQIEDRCIHIEIMLQELGKQLPGISGEELTSRVEKISWPL